MITPFSYLIASVCFIVALQALSSPTHARRGNAIGAFGMLVAVVGTLMLYNALPGAPHRILTFKWIGVGLILGSIIGASMAIWIPMTKMPERIALSHSFGGLAAALVGVSEYHHLGAEISRFTMGALGLEVFFGFLTFTGSLMAFGKLQGFCPAHRSPTRARTRSNIGMFVAALALLVLVVLDPSRTALFYRDGHDRLVRRRPVRDPDRRRGHAGGDLAAQLVRRPRRRGHRLRPEQLRADHRRRARRHLRASCCR